MIDVWTDLGSLDESFVGSSYEKLRSLLLEDSLVSTDDKVVGSDEGIKLVLSYGNVIGTILINLYGIILGIDVGTELVSLDGSYEVFNHGKIERLSLGDSFWFTTDKRIG